MDVLVIGGGIIGLTAALELASSGANVEVVDDARPGRASPAGAGIIPPGNFAGAETPYDRLRAWSSEEFRRRFESENSIDYCINGAFDCDVELSRAGAWKREGIIARRRGMSWFLPGMARVRNDLFLEWLKVECLRAGVRLTHETCRDLDDRKHCLIAGGAWSAELLESRGIPVGIHPVRGQIVLYKPLSSSGRYVAEIGGITLLDGKRYIVPRGDGTVLVGSTEEPAAGFDAGTTSDGIAELVAFAESIHPILGQYRPIRTWSGLRPALAEPIPYIGRAPNHPKLFVAAGHFRAGTQLCFGTARLVADLMLDRPPLVDPAMFSLDRPPLRDVQLAFRS